MERITKMVACDKLLNLRAELQNLKTKKGVKLAIAVNRNLQQIGFVLDPIENGYRDKLLSIGNVKEYEEKKREIQGKYAIKDENGNIIYSIEKNGGKSFRVAVNNPDYQKEVAEFEAKYAQTIKEIDEANKEYNEEMDKEVQVDFYCIDADSLPEDITGEEIENCVEYDIIG